MKKAYGERGQARLGTASWSTASAYGYVVGNNLVFETQDLHTISAVGLYRGSPGTPGVGARRRTRTT